MKQVFLTLTLLLLTLLPAEAVKKHTPNPINLAITLVEKTDSANVASTLTYYGYTPHGIEEGYQIMKDPNGNEIRYSFKESNANHKYPTVIVKTHHSNKEIDSKLKELGFKNTENGYEHMKNRYSKYKTQCRFGPKNTMIILHLQN